MPTNLGQFLRTQLDLQQLPEKEFSKRADMGLSHVYQILRGERKHARADTLDKIAYALNMTPAEMAAAMGRGNSHVDLDPELAALLRQLPAEHRPTLKSMLRGLIPHPAAEVTNGTEDLGRDNCHKTLPRPPIRQRDINRAQSRSVASMIERYGLVPSFALVMYAIAASGLCA